MIFLFDDNTSVDDVLDEIEAYTESGHPAALLYDALLTNEFEAHGANNAIDNCINWLHSTDFYNAPASTVYHNHFQGGLLQHSLDVMKQIIDLKRCEKFSKVSIHSAILVALVHDWCKIGLYESYLKNVKDDVTGVWHQELAYKHKATPLTCFGHGVSSMYLVEQFIHLSIDEMLAIRWHMGEYNVANNEMNDLHQANETYPLVQMLQFADRLSITKY